MLVLTRRIGESVVIADKVTVTVLRCRSNRVRLGIAAPPDTAIRRPPASRPAADQTGDHLPRKG